MRRRLKLHWTLQACIPKYQYGGTGRQKVSGAHQINLLIDRRDHCINVCEIKFLIDEFEITKAYAADLENKLKVFRSNTKTRKTLFLTMITTYGVKNEIYYPGFVQKDVTMDALFILPKGLRE